MKGHAEIAGGGIGGLALGTLLCQRGWSVRVHERSPEIREIGAGIYIKENSIRVMEEAGMFAKLADRGIRLEKAQVRDCDGKLLLERPHNQMSARVYVFTRQALIEEWRDAAISSGVDLVTNSRVVGSEPSGKLLLEGGHEISADLVVGCDGFSSQVRESLKIGATSHKLPTLINRYLLPHRRFTQELITTENYAGQRRIGVTPCAENMSYIFLVAPIKELIANQIPLDVKNWVSMFPNLSEMLHELSLTEGTSHQYCLVRCPKWQKGKVALLGDAATGMPPTLGQGAGLTIMNARALAEALDRSPCVEVALPKWESAVRNVSDLTQNWALRYDWITRTCPPSLSWLKPHFMGTMQAIPAINRRMRIADRGMDLILPKVIAKTN